MEILDHDGPMIDCMDSDTEDDVIERIESIEGQKIVKGEYDWNNRCAKVLLVFEKGIYDSLEHVNGRAPSQEDFTGNNTVLVRCKEDFVLMRYDKKAYYVPRRLCDRNLSIVATENAVGEMVCTWDPELASILDAKREATAAKVRAKLCKPKPAKPRNVKEPQLRGLTHLLVNKIERKNWVDTRKWTLTELVVAMIYLSDTESPEVMWEIARPLAQQWMELREENVQKFSDMWGKEPTKRLDEAFAKIPPAPEEPEAEETVEEEAEQSQESQELVAV